MAPVARGLTEVPNSYPGTPDWGAVVFMWLFLGTLCTGTESGAPGATEGRERIIEGERIKFHTAEKAGELGEGDRKHQDLPIPGFSGDPVCAGVKGILPFALEALLRPC